MNGKSFGDWCWHLWQRLKWSPVLGSIHNGCRSLLARRWAVGMGCFTAAILYAMPKCVRQGRGIAYWPGGWIPHYHSGHKQTLDGDHRRRPMEVS